MPWECDLPSDKYWHPNIPKPHLLEVYLSFAIHEAIMKPWKQANILHMELCPVHIQALTTHNCARKLVVHTVASSEQYPALFTPKLKADFHRHLTHNGKSVIAIDPDEALYFGWKILHRVIWAVRKKHTETLTHKSSKWSLNDIPIVLTVAWKSF